MKDTAKYYEAHEHWYRTNLSEQRPGFNPTKTYPYIYAVIDEFLDQSWVPKDGYVIEMGCGAGEVSLHLAERGFNVVGVDISETAIEHARRKALKCESTVVFLTGDVCCLEGMLDERFDIVVDGHCLHCLVEEDDRRSYLKECYRLLRPGGTYYLHTMVSRDEASITWIPSIWPVGVHGTVKKEGGLFFPGRYHGTPERVREEVTETGFTTVFERFDEESHETIPHLLVYAKKDRNHEDDQVA